MGFRRMVEKKIESDGLPDEFKDTLQRLQAEFENYKKRSEKEKAEAVSWGKYSLAEKLLPTLDAFDAAVRHHPHDDGLRALRKELVERLKKEGLEEIACKGKPFDHELHEAVQQAESSQDGIVLEELQKGYVFQGKLLRASKVKVGKKKEMAEAKEKNE